MHPIIFKAENIYNSLSQYKAPEDVLFEFVGKAQEIHHIASLVLAWAKYRHVDLGLDFELPYLLTDCKKSASAWKVILALPDTLKVTRNFGTWSGGSEGKANFLDHSGGLAQDLAPKLTTNYDVIPPSDQARREAAAARLPYKGVRRVVDRERCRVFDNKRGVHIPLCWTRN